MIHCTSGSSRWKHETRTLSRATACSPAASHECPHAAPRASSDSPHSSRATLSCRWLHGTHPRGHGTINEFDRPPYAIRYQVFPNPHTSKRAPFKIMVQSLSLHLIFLVSPAPFPNSLSSTYSHFTPPFIFYKSGPRQEAVKTIHTELDITKLSKFNVSPLPGVVEIKQETHV